MKDRANQYQVVAFGSATPSLADAAILTAPDVVSLPSTLAISQGAHTQLRVILSTLFGTDHPTVLAMKEANVEIMERETDLEEYNSCDWGLKARLPAPITHWVQIIFSD